MQPPDAESAIVSVFPFSERGRIWSGVLRSLFTYYVGKDRRRAMDDLY